MILVKRIKGFMRLAVVCLVVEQLGYLVLVPGYYWALLASPVFWGLFSVVCFYQLWRLNKECPDESISLEGSEIWTPVLRINPTTGLPMAGGIDVCGTPYGGSPESGLFKLDIASRSSL